MRLIDAEKLEKALETEITTMRECVKAIGMEDDKGIQMALISHEDILEKIKKEETIEAISIDWIEAEIKRLRAMDFEFATMTAGMIEAMLKRWKERQE